MFATDDTIVAIATPPGRGAIGVIRISGPRAAEIARVITTATSLAPRHATLTRVRVPDPTAFAQGIDRVVATYFPQPQSYTGQDVVEVSAHGSPVVLQTIMRLAIEAGARLARAGEFTLRAFLAGRLDLVQAEAVADLIAAATPLQARAAFDQLEGTLTHKIAELDAELFDLIAKLEASLDFPDEGYHFIEADEARSRLSHVIEGIDAMLADARRGRLIREGTTVVLAGRPNVGKSSLFNALAGADRTIVTEVPGTTRDLITEAVDINGIAVTLVDTAGAREAADVIEREGVRRGRDARSVAGLILIIIDGSLPLTSEDEALFADTAQQRRLLVANKCDLPPAIALDGAVPVSALTGQGLDVLRCAMARALGGDESARDLPAVTNLRHVALLEDTRASLCRAVAAFEEGSVPEEFVLPDMQSARTRLDEIVGVRTSEDVLNHIFATFCIGK